MPRCDFCFQSKPCEPVYPRVKAQVCRACAYKVNQVIGFLAHSGIGLHIQEELDLMPSENLTPLPPRETPKKVRKPAKSKSKVLKPERGTLPLPDTS